MSPARSIPTRAGGFASWLMRWLPPLVTPAGQISLPISGRAEQFLVAAILLGSDGTDERLVGEALACDPALTLWATLRSAQSGDAEILSLEPLSEWLAAATLEKFSTPSCATPCQDSAPDSDPTAAAKSADGWADLAAESLAIASLAARVAEHRKLDFQRAYFLGLLHLAAGWLAKSSTSASRPALEAALPAGLAESLAAIHTSAAAGAAGKITTAEHSVAAAIRLAGSKGSPGRALAGFKFNRREYAAQVAAARGDWLSPSGSGTLSALVRKLNRLQALEQDFQRTLENEKLDALKELAYGAGHEINNPLANISARAQTLLQLERNPDRRRLLAAIHTQAFRAYEMIADMMLFARPPQPRREAVELGPLLREVVDELVPQARSTNTELILRLPAAPVTICADKTQIAVAVRAVCVNALEALTSGGRVDVELHEPTSLSNTAQLTISDTGPGIAEETRRHIFDPFYSGREAGRGLGFGLSKCWRIVTMHGGQVAVESSPGKGAQFTISLPKSNGR